jgi:hypothetical protein
VRGRPLGRADGQCWDNALAESFLSSLKGELIDTRAWPTRAGARRAVVEYIGWYNGTRLHRSLGQLTSAQADSHPPDPVNLAEQRIRRKQVLGGLTHEYYAAA